VVVIVWLLDLQLPLQSVPKARRTPEPVQIVRRDRTGEGIYLA
jgi:hypothetical protein